MGGGIYSDGGTLSLAWPTTSVEDPAGVAVVLPGLGGDAGDLASRRETYGANYIEPPAMKTYWELIHEL